MGGILVSDDPFANIFPIWESLVFFWGDVTEHRAAIPTDHRRSYPTGQVIVSWRYVGGQRAEGVEWSAMAPFNLFLHILLNKVHGNVTRSFVHDLTALFPGTGSEFSLDLQFGQLGIVVGICNRSGAEPVTDRKADIVSGADITDIVPMGIEKILLVVR